MFPFVGFRGNKDSWVYGLSSWWIYLLPRIGIQCELANSVELPMRSSCYMYVTYFSVETLLNYINHTSLRIGEFSSSPTSRQCILFPFVGFPE